MQGTNVLFGQVLTVFAIVIAGVWGATQWTAAALGYQLGLGAPWFEFFDTPQCAIACGAFFVCAPARTLFFFSTFVPITVFDRH